MQLYRKKKKLIKEVEIENSLDFPPLLPIRPNKVQNIAITLYILIDCNPIKFSDNSKETWKITIKKVNI